jgi:hypothetical protein
LFFYPGLFSKSMVGLEGACVDKSWDTRWNTPYQPPRKRKDL